MADRSILVTGASSGIGADAARTLHRRGWRVFATARKDADLARLRADGIEAFFLDYEDEASIEACAAAVLEATGGRLDALYNNGAHGQVGALEDLPTEALRRQFEAGLFGWHTLTRAVIPAMRTAGRGRIVQCSSVLGFLPGKYRGAYVAVKHALEGMTDCLRIELAGSGIDVVLIEPGPIDTRFTENALAHLPGSIDVEHSFHREGYQRQLAAAKALRGRSWLGAGPEAVTAAIVHAVESPHPKIRYRVTVVTKLGAVLDRLLPAALVDRLVAMN